MKASRNQPCPCGSGKKFKQCCGRQGAMARGATVTMPDGASLPLAEALQAATQLHQAGRPRLAAEIYQRILNIQPEHADALHLLGLTAHQIGEHARALGLIGQAIRLKPSAGIFYNHLGKVQRALGQIEAAMASYRQALALQPDLAVAQFNLGEALRESGNLPDAIRHLQAAVALNPRYTDALFALGAALQAERRLDEACQQYERALAVSPADPLLCNNVAAGLRLQGKLEQAIVLAKRAIALKPDQAVFHYNLALALQAQNKLAEAASALEKALALNPQDETYRHRLDSLRNVTTERAPAAYVRDTFDHYAENFDAHLVDKLEYRTPQQLAELIGTHVSTAVKGLDVLDMGCGTGLFGACIKHCARRLVGVDLSPKMIAQADKRAIYDELAVADLLEWLGQQEAASFDLLAASDVLNYLGNLSPVFEQARRVLRIGGLFAFSIEIATNPDQDYCLTLTGRYCQSPAYIRRLAQAQGYSEVAMQSVVIRKEKGVPVPPRRSHRCRDRARRRRRRC